MTPRRPLAGPVPATLHRRLRPAALSVALLVAGAAQADTLVLANGDRLTGTLVSADAHRIVFRSDMLGQVEVAAGQARVEPTPSAIATHAVEAGIWKVVQPYLEAMTANG